MINLSSHFNDMEFACSCGCGEKKVASSLIRLLEKIRRHFGVPVKVTSGKRCATWNEAVGGSKTSQHLLGKAADIRVEGVSPGAVANYVDSLCCDGGLGRYHTFTHVDVRKRKARWDSR